ncbi:MAG: hypothetical protein AB1898_21640 [Acidobacteriota bacterium]
MAEYHQLNKVSSYEKGALMVGVGQKNAPGIDAVDLDNAKGISLKTASNPDRVEDRAKDAFKQATKSGFHDVQVYIDAPGVSKSEVTGVADIQSTLGDGTITKVVIFTGEGPVEYRPTEAEQKEIEKRVRCRENREGGFSCP